LGDSGSSPEYDISLCLVGKRCVEGEHREHSLQAIELFIVDRKPMGFSPWDEKDKNKNLFG